MRETIINCPECGEEITAFLNENRYGKAIIAKCNECGFYEQLTNFDLLQPSSPFYEEIYGENPLKIFEKEKKKKQKDIENLKDRREIELRLKAKRGVLKSYEVKEIKKIAEYYNL